MQSFALRLGTQAKALKRARYEKPYEYKRKGNQEQAAFNAKVDEAVAEAELHIEEAGPSTAPALERAKEALKKGRQFLAERQKLIKVADRSEHGWGVVQEYTANELAEDSGDEKRLEKAERAAELKAAKRRKKKASSVQSSRSRSLSVRMPGAAAREPAPPYHVPSSSTRRFASMTAPTPVRRVVGPCYACGEMGHMRMSCPRVAGPDRSRRWYPLLIGDIVHESGVDGRPPERSGCDVDDVVCENLSGDVAPRSEFLTGDVEYEELSRMWEIELSPPSCSIKGRLRKHLSFWRAELNASSTVLNTIESGYVLPLKSEPTEYHRENQVSALRNNDFVQQCIQELTDTGCIEVVAEAPFVCSPLSVVENSVGKKRLVINLRHLNRFLWKQRFRYEDLRVAMTLFEKGDYLFSFDLKAGYHHIDIAETHRKYLGFSWQKRYYVFTVLPFGLSTACYIFYKDSPSSGTLLAS